MALLLKTSTVADEASHNIKRTNLTGTYNVTTNPGGYGAAQIPAGFREVVDINSARLHILSMMGTIEALGGTDFVTTELLYSKAYTNLEAQAFATTPETLDLGALIGDDYVDGVYFASYVEWFPPISTVTTPGVVATKIITVSNYTEFTGARYIAIDTTSTGSYLYYEIVKVNTDNTIEINIAVILGGVARPYRVGYEVINYFANVFDINKCLHSSIAKTACSDCKCNELKLEKHFTAVMQFFGIQTNMDRGNYKCSQELIDAITIYCSKHGCGCGC